MLTEVADAILQVRGQPQGIHSLKIVRNTVIDQLACRLMEKGRMELVMQFTRSLERSILSRPFAPPKCAVRSLLVDHRRDSSWDRKDSR